ncbi:MAG TPA: response regulator [Flavisolibacter sp.]|nr:response regulator [Flavisolibacter sp.]
MPTNSILIIDDDVDDVEILADAFTQSGVQGVHYVHTAMQAFMYLESIADSTDLPKLIVTDYYLAGITGPQFLADLKQMKRYQHIPVIVLSTTKTERQIEQYKALGILEYIEKPSTYDEYLKVATEIKSRINTK